MAAAYPQAWKNRLGRQPHSIAESALTTGPSAFPDDADVANWLDTGGQSNGATLLRCVRTESAPVAASRLLKSGRHDRGTPPCRARMVPPMTFSTKEIEDGAWEFPAAEGIAMIEQMLPDFQKQIDSEPEGATECQDLMAVSFRTFHFDSVVRVPG